MIALQSAMEFKLRREKNNGNDSERGQGTKKQQQRKKIE